MKDKYLNKEDALVKLQKYCAYQDRCHQEVRTKLLDLGVRGYDLEWVIAELIQEKFLDETRFAASYVRGKYRIKKWGRIKITIELKKRKISPYCLKKGLEEIDEEEYLDNLKTLLEKKKRTIKAKTEWEMRRKLTRFAQTKGYEYENISQCIKLIESEE